MKKGRGEGAREKKGRGETEKGRQGEKKSHLPIPLSPRPSVTPSPGPAHLSSPFPLITLLTDFGTADYFVSAMKGVILSINPSARIVDITHETTAQDIGSAAFTLLAAYGAFPQGTIHVAVVDPGVGSDRRAILVEAGGHLFVGPDNGIFSYVCERETGAVVLEITNEDYFRRPISPTFHGRDVFAPVAAALTTGARPEELGKEINNPVRLARIKPERSKDGTIAARIIHVDHFGNCITNLTHSELTAKMIEKGAYLIVKGTRIRAFRRFFSEQDGSKGLFCIWGSAGFLELAATNRSAAKVLKVKRGDQVILRMKK